jgi:transposase
VQRYQQVQTLVAQGRSILQIAVQLGMSRSTVTAFAVATTFPERATQRGQASILDPYTAYLTQRWTEGETNASQLWREFQTQGYAGVRKQVARWV